MDKNLDALPIDPSYNEEAKKIVLKHFDGLYSTNWKDRRICHVLKAIFDNVNDPEIKDLVMQATWFAFKMNRKLNAYRLQNY